MDSKQVYSKQITKQNKEHNIQKQNKNKNKYYIKILRNTIFLGSLICLIGFLSDNGSSESVVFLLSVGGTCIVLWRFVSGDIISKSIYKVANTALVCTILFIILHNFNY